MMQALQPYKGYLPWLALLLLARFIWQPLWTEKSENWQQIQVSQNTLEKTKALLDASEQMKSAQQQISAMVEGAQNKLIPAENLTRVKIDTQQQIEQLFTQHNLTISLSSWRDGIVKTNVQTLVLDLSFSGQLVDYLNLQSDLQAQSPFASMVFVEQRLTIRNQNETQLGEISGDVSIRVAIQLKGAS